MDKSNTAHPGVAPAVVDRKRKLLSWGKLLAWTILAIYFYVFMEWLFYVTKPSFMSLSPFGTKLGILLLSGLALLGLSLPLLLALFALSLAPWWSKHRKVFLYIGGVLPAAFIAVTALMMIDNFTYTVFQYGIISTVGIQRGMYGLLFLLILFVSVRWMVRTLSGQTRRKRANSALKVELSACVALLVLSTGLGWNLYRTDQPAYAIPVTGSAVTRPNILLIGTDGLDADHTSLYNPQTDTTPFLETFAQSALVAENNFPNAYQTSGSLVSIFTSKLPTETRMLYPPDILEGADAFQNFPAILKSEGYYNAEISVDYYGDATMFNLQDSFVMVNGRSSTVGGLYTLARGVLPEDTAYFLATIAKGLSDRLLQIYYIHTMANPYAEVTQPPIDMNDQHRVDQLMSLFETVQQPLFVHVHMMGTHLGDEWNLYDPAIKAYDGYMREVVDGLKEMGKLDQTVIIVYTDHGFTDVSNVRIPLMFRFPNGEYAGTITNNTQNLDIGPTILNYLGITPPAWMNGQSLLKDEPPATQPIFSAAPNYRTGNAMNELQLDLSKIKPPFYQFGTIGMVICQKWYAVNTTSMTWQEGDVEGYPTPCDASVLPDDSQAKQILLNQLKTNGFDISTLQAALFKPQTSG